MLIADDGTPLGQYIWDDNEGIWLYDPFPPLGGLTLPRTGSMFQDSGVIAMHHLLFTLSIIFMLAAIALHLSARREYAGKYARQPRPAG